jgi:hypothetical protein
MKLEVAWKDERDEYLWGRNSMANGRFTSLLSQLCVIVLVSDKICRFRDEIEKTFHGGAVPSTILRGCI